MTLRRRLQQVYRRLRRKVSKYLPILIVVFLMGGCANFMNDTKNSTLSKTTTTTQRKQGYRDVKDLTGLMSYLGTSGYTYDNEMEIADLEDGFLEGRRFQNNGMDYSIYRFDNSNETLNTSIEQARTTNRMRMNVGGTQEDVPVFIADNYLVTYPEGADISALKGYFQ